MLSAVPKSGYRVSALFTVGEWIGDYQPPGVIDGLAAFELDAATFRVLANHELASGAGYPYELANGTTLAGSRISFFDIDKKSRRIVAAGLAYWSVYDRTGRKVADPSQISERPSGTLHGFANFCSAAGYVAGEFGFIDDIFFTHEEDSAAKKHPHGGSVWALDVKSRALWALPALGRGSWEGSTAIATPDQNLPDGHIAMLLGDDLEFGSAPLYLWIGQKIPGGDFPARNGLSEGRLYAWVADNGARSPEDWRGTGATVDGHFTELEVLSAHDQGEPGFDSAGYLDDVTLRAEARDAGAFMFSRPEDLHTDPANGSRIAFASTGHGRRFPSDDWGTLYLINIDLRIDDGQAAPIARLTILHDADELGDAGIRSPDNLVWARDGMIYVQEDAAAKLGSFGEKSGREASIWRIDPDNPDDYARIAEIDRRVIRPRDASDSKAGEIGAWESSGIIDVTALFDSRGEHQFLLATVQAHGIRDGTIGGWRQLVQGGQIVLLEK